MTLFVAVASLLAGAALLFVLPPLLRKYREGTGEPSQDAANVEIYRDQLQELDAELAAAAIAREQYAAARAEIERRVLEEVPAPEAGGAAKGAARGLAIALAFGMPVLATGLYLMLGNPRGLDPRSVATPVEEGAAALTTEQIAGMADRLAARLQENPGDAEGWAMLGRSYSVLERHEDAARAYRKAVALVPNDAQLVVDLADALAMARGRHLEGEPERLVARALEIDPTNIKALALAGTIAFQKQDFAAAIKHWRAMLAQLPEDSDLAASTREGIAAAESRLRTQPMPRRDSPAASRASP